MLKISFSVKSVTDFNGTANVIFQSFEKQVWYFMAKGGIELTHAQKVCVWGKAYKLEIDDKNMITVCFTETEWYDENRKAQAMMYAILSMFGYPSELEGTFVPPKVWFNENPRPTIPYK